MTGLQVRIYDSENQGGAFDGWMKVFVVVFGRSLYSHVVEVMKCEEIFWRGVRRDDRAADSLPTGPTIRRQVRYRGAVICTNLINSVVLGEKLSSITSALSPHPLASPKSNNFLAMLGDKSQQRFRIITWNTHRQKKPDCM